MDARGRRFCGDQRGSKNPRSILNEKQVKEIVGLLRSASNTEIAERYGVTHSTISSIRRGKIWKHLTNIA